MAKPGNEVINLKDDDFKRKSFKRAPAGTYICIISKKSKLKRMKKGMGVQLQLTILKDGKGRDTKHAKVHIFDNIGASVTWKIGQLLAALGIKKMKLTVAQLLELVKSKKLRVIIRVERFGGQDRNKVVQFLPLKPGKDEEEDSDDDEADEDDDTSSEDDENDEDSSSDDEDSDDDSSSDDDEDSSSDDDDEDSSSDDEDSDDSDDDDDDSSDDDEDGDVSSDEDDEDAGSDDDEDEEPKKKPAKKPATKPAAKPKAGKAKPKGGKKK